MSTPNKPVKVPKELALKPWIRGPPPNLVLKNVRIVDPKDSVTKQRFNVILVNGKIKSVIAGVRFGEVEKELQNLKLEGEVQQVDLQDKYYLCPGLIDCHVHVTAVPGIANVKDAMNLSPQTVTLRSTYILKEMLLRGFTTVRDTGGASAELATATEEWLIPGPRIIPCGKALSQTGGHGDFRATDGTMSICCGGGMGHDPAAALGRTCDGVPGVTAAVRDEIRKGAKFIKVMCGGGVASPTDTLESIQFTSAELQAITEICNNMGSIPTTAHAYTPASILHAINNGITGIEHGNFLDRATARIMKEKGIWLTPTLSCYEIMTRPPFEDFLPDSGKVKNDEVRKRGLEGMKIAHEEGVKICYGSDLLVSMHALQTEEFTVRSAVLQSPDILKHATTNAAQMLRMEGQIGEIIAGAFADLIILDKNPLADVTILDAGLGGEYGNGGRGGGKEKSLKAVIKGGYVVWSDVEGLEGCLSI